MKKVIFGVLLCVRVISFCNAQTNQDTAEEILPAAKILQIEKFPERFSLGVNATFNFINFGFEGLSAISNAPVYLGFLGAYRDFALFFSLAHPGTYTKTSGKSTAFDAGITFYQKHWSEEMSIEFYDDFLVEGAPFDMQYISGRLQGMYNFNSDNFSLQSAYPINRLQRRSAGSLLAGADMRVTTIKSRDITLINNRHWFFDIGPGAGYSWTFVFQNYFFVNLYIFTSANFRIDCTSGRLSISPAIVPKIAIGKHSKTWSFNFVLDLSTMFDMSPNRSVGYLLNNSAVLSFVKRF
jgi:hypothetical protein